MKFGFKKASYFSALVWMQIWLNHVVSNECGYYIKNNSYDKKYFSRFYFIFTVLK